MGLFSRKLRQVEQVASLPGAQGAMRTRVRVATPHTENSLRSVAYADILGVEHQIVTRDEAITVPAVASARWLICHPLSSFPLRAYEGDQRLPDADQPVWLSRTGGRVPWQFRTLWTLDDLIFEGWSLWQVERSATDGWTTAEGDWVGAPTGAVRVPLERWDFDSEDQVLIDGVVQDEMDVLLFQSPQDPLLIAGRRTIRGARMLEDQWVKGLDAVPVMEIRQTEDIDLDEDPDSDEPDEAQQIVDDYVAARKAPNGAVVFTPYGYELNAHGAIKHELYTEGRNYSVLDVARHLALPPNLMGASQVSASLTYSTKEGSRSELRDLVQSGWAMALAARLSLDDCVRPGLRVGVDMSDQTGPDDGLGPDQKD